MNCVHLASTCPYNHTVREFEWSSAAAIVELAARSVGRRQYVWPCLPSVRRRSVDVGRPVAMLVENWAVCLQRGQPPADALSTCSAWACPTSATGGLPLTLQLNWLETYWRHYLVSLARHILAFRYQFPWAPQCASVSILADVCNALRGVIWDRCAVASARRLVSLTRKMPTEMLLLYRLISVSFFCRLRIYYCAISIH